MVYLTLSSMVGPSFAGKDKRPNAPMPRRPRRLGEDVYDRDDCVFAADSLR